MTWGAPTRFCQGQAHKMAVVPLIDSQFAVMFADQAAAPGPSGAPDAFGNSLLASVGTSGEVDVLGRFRFLDQALCRLEVTKVTPTAFVVAARAAAATDDFDAVHSVQQDAIAIFAELNEGVLAFDPNPVSVAPQGRPIWARGVSLIAPNTVGYAYLDGTDLTIKLTIMEISPTTHRLRVVRGPLALHSGFSPYVSMISVPYSLESPHTLVYYQDESRNASMLSVCSWDVAQRRLSRCEGFPWLDERLHSVSGMHLGRGMSFFAYATEEGVPYYSVFSLQAK
uniref:Uncharacterized protein n=1 Tax=Zooxanthella nutricula TaxID=1333877 RepID=A0A7S2L9C7_9DINO|mmetsp:Transcript_58356/g.177918  ORF Transcript_58356/g.177918 Transcript_58356/m.177918 type:complete len:282 (+) Transcript_58356:1-846(+)